MEIRHYDAICNTPALRLAVRCWQELLDRNLIDDGAMAVGWDHKAIVAFGEDGSAIGVMTWVVQEWANGLFVFLAYVVPERRRQGVHTAMWNALVAKAIELKRPVIVSGTSIHNDAARKAMAAQGRVETGTYTRFRVPDAG
jgi:GNAT superfamily N-acetyltransferase